MAPKATEDSDAAVAFVLGGGSIDAAMARWPSLKYGSLWARVARMKKRALSDAAKETADLKVAAEKKKKRRVSYNRTSTQVEKAWAEEAREQAERAENYKAAVKEGARLVGTGMAQATAARKVSAFYKVDVSTYILRKYADGSSPVKQGRPPEKNKAVVLAAVASFSRAEQTSKILTKSKTLGGLALGLLESHSASSSSASSSSSAALAKASQLRMFRTKRLARDLRQQHPELSTTQLGGSVVEEARLRWCRESWLKEWTAGFEAFLLHLEFAELRPDPIVNSKGRTERIRIFSDQLCNIVNFDEKQCNTDSDGGSQGSRGNRLVDRSLPHATPGSKSSVSQTEYHAALASGEALAPFFNFKSMATDPERMKISANVLAGMPRVMIKAGMHEAIEMSTTFMISDTGGTTKESFLEIFETWIAPLYVHL